MSRAYAKIILLSVLLLSSSACVSTAPRGEDTAEPAAPVQAGATDDRRVLAGEWEYEDGTVVTLELDERGNGPYLWKQGRLETRSFVDHTWQGIWYQKENDREGGFSVEFAPDFSEGEGRWWYTRIGADQAPSQKGGTFHLSRKTSAVGETPAAP